MLQLFVCSYCQPRMTYTCYDDVATRVQNFFSQHLGIRVYSSVYLEFAIRLRAPSHTSDTGPALPETGTTDQPCFTFLDFGTEAADTGVLRAARFEPRMASFAS